MDIESIFNIIKMANYPEQAIKEVMDNIHSFNLESKKETLSALQQRKGSLDSAEKNQILESIIILLEKEI